MKFKAKQRIAILMSLFMAISLLPTGFVGGNVLVKAEEAEKVASGTYGFKGKTVADVNAIAGITVDSGFADDSHSHGIESTAGGTITLALSGDANVYVTTCMYGTTGMQASSGVVTQDGFVQGTADGVYTVANALAGDLVLTFAEGTNYVHEIGVEYLSDISNVAEGTYDFRENTYNDIDIINAIPGLSVSGLSKHNSHGTQTGGGTITLDLASPAKVTIEECMYGSYVPTAGDYDVETVQEYKKNEADGIYAITVTNAGRVVINLSGSGSAYIHSVKIEYITAEQHTVAVTTEGNGSAQASKDNAYKDDVITLTATPNTAATFKEWVVVTPSGLTVTDASAATTTFIMPDEAVEIKAVFEGGLTESPVENTKINDFDFTGSFSTLNAVGATATLVSGQTIKLGKLSSSGVSFDSKGFVKFRAGNVIYLPITNADTTKVVIRMVCSQSDGTRYITLGSSADGLYKVYVSTTEQSITVPDIDDFVVTDGGVRYLPVISTGEVKAYHIYIDEYNPVNSVVVSGTVTGADTNQITEIRFKNLTDTDKPVITADIKNDGTYSATLKRVDGNTKYVASISKSGYKIDDSGDANVFALTGNAATFPKDFTVVEAPVVKLAGVVTGVDDDMLKGELSVKLVPENNTLDEVTLNLTKISDGTYSYSEVIIQPDAEYGVVLINADDYEVIGKINKAAGTYSTESIAATKKALISVTGEFVTSDEKNANVTGITFTLMDTPEYSYTFPVNGNTYNAELREGEYETTVAATGYAAYDHVSVKDTKVRNDVYIVAPVDSSVVDYKEVITVGTAGEFKSIQKAVDYIARMDRGDKRVTLKLLDEEYMEQVIVNTPNITMISARDNGSTISWYYGVGVSYYSAKPALDNKNGSYYDEAYAVDKYYKTAVSQNPGHWGATVNLFKNATGFKAENITFENTFNRRLTQEELLDGAAENANTQITARNAEGIDVLSKAAKERAAVLYIQADNTEYKNCKLLSSQDTLYTGDANENSYFVNCVIEGTTDYICGDGNAVFDKCTLSMYSYSDQAAVGSYIVANKKQATYGYIFNDCSIVTTSMAGVKGTSGNYLARAWAAGKIVYLNTEVESADMICDKAYSDMNEKVVDADYREYNTHTPDGTVVDMSKRANGVKVIGKEEAEAIDIKTYFGSWTPVYYENNKTPDDSGDSSETSQQKDTRRFVERLYQLVFGRPADEGGKTAWINALTSGTSSGVDAGYGFLFSDECKNRNLDNEEFVEILYKTFMDRESDEGGKTAWVSQLNAGVDREKVFEGFVMSQEFTGVCENYGIRRGEISDAPAIEGASNNYRNRNANVTKFAARCYTEALGRKYETDGLEAWCKVILEKSNTPKQVAQNFIFSDEFIQKNLNNEEYVKVLYRTFMGREADEGGLNAWVNVLASGREDRAKVLEGFSDSAEFAEILKSFGLN